MTNYYRVSSIFMAIALTCFAVLLKAQSTAVTGLKNYIAAITTMRERLPIEKLYLQLDKPYYTTGDTIRIKGYLLNSDFLTPSPRSGIVYIELDDENGKLIKRIMSPVNFGLAWADIAIDEKSIPNGNYILRAYTNWMRNFGEDYVFKKYVYISSATGNATLVKANFSKQGNKVESVLRFTGLDGRPQLLKDMELSVMNGKKNLLKSKVNTGVDGTVQTNFDLPESTAVTKDNFYIIAKDNTGADLTIPIKLNRPENIDVQFMPEGGNLIAGLSAKIGFKAINESGYATPVNGKVYNSHEQQIATIKTTHAGMGSFEFIPQVNESYNAKINLPDGSTKNYPLPQVRQNGTTLQVKLKNEDSLQVTVQRLSGPDNASPDYYLIGQSRTVVCYAQAISFADINKQTLAIATNLFPSGIARFTLINANHQPVNERQVFINRDDALQINIAANKANYGIRDSIGLTLTIKDKDGKPVEGSFSMAVTDNNQVKTDSMASNILSSMLLTSDLKGTVEEPGYYFINPKQKQAELDNLLLTQGWIGYNWKDVLYPEKPTPEFAAEKEFTINGTVTNAAGKPIEKSNVVMVVNHPLSFRDTLTNQQGRFTFKDMFPVDTAIFKLQARNKNGRERNVQLKVDELKLPDFLPVPAITPWYVNGDSIRLKNNTTKAAQIKATTNYNGEGRMLNEVTIKDKRIIKGSKNLNGPGEADQILDEEELGKAGKITLEALLFQKIKGFNIGPFTPGKREYGPSLELINYLRHDFPLLGDDSALMIFYEKYLRTRKHTPWRMGYKINAQEVHFIVDGIDLDFFYDDSQEVISGQNGVTPNDNKRYLFIKPYLDYYKAEDISGIELMSSQKYAANYDANFELNRDRVTPGKSNEFAYLEITTYSKKGPFMQTTPGTYLYKTLPFTLAKQFYSPKYTVKNKNLAMGTDMRSTLYWEPNVITDKDGKASVNFYSADKPSTYTLIIEGIDMNGNLGYKRQKIN